MTDLGRRLTRLEAAGVRLEGPHSPMVIYDAAKGAEAAVRRLYGDAPPPFLVVIPDNGRDPQPPHPAAPGHGHR